MTATNKLGLELLQNAAANQTLANITFARLNQLVQGGVVDKDLTAPPASPADESLYIVGASATGAWAGREGQLAYWLNTADAWNFLPPKEGFFLHVNDEDVFYKFTGTAWEVFSGGGGGGGMTNPMTTIRDLIVGGVGGAPTRLAGPTSEGMMLTRIGNALAWAIATGFANPMTAGGDIIIGGANGSATRLGAGSAGQVLTIVAGAPAWVTPSGGGGGGDFKADGSVQMTGALNEAPPVELGPTSSYRLPLALPAAKSNTIKVIAGAVSFFNSMDALPLGSRRQLVFTVATQIISSTSLVLLASNSIEAAVGDTAEFAMYADNVWRMTRFDRFDGTPLKAGADLTALDLAGTRKMTGPINEATRVIVASQAVLSVGLLNANTIEITGTNDIASLGSGADGMTRRLLFVASLMISNNADTLRLPGGADLQTRAGDTAEFLCRGGSSWQCLWYQRKDGTALVASAGFTEEQVRKTPLTGLPATTGDVTETDGVLSGIGKLQASKVAKESGKGLSANDYTTTEKNKLAGIAEGAQVNSVTSVAGRTGAVTLAKGDVGLGNVTNTADAEKPVSTAQQSALDAKVDKSSAVTSVAGRTGAVTLAKADVGLANVDNTADSTKPVSVVQQAALDLKLDNSSPSAANDFTLTRYSNSAGTSANVVMQRLRGSAASPSPVLANDRIGSLTFQTRASDGADYGNVVLEAYAREDQTANGKGALFQFSTVKVGANARSVALAIDNAGQISMPSGFYAAGPGRLAPFTLTTLPNPAAWTNFLIIVTNATGGSKVCWSNGTNWCLLNTNTTVS